MNVLINSKDTIVEDMIEGFILCNKGKVKRVNNLKAILKTNLDEKVIIIIGGGGGNEPWPTGYVNDDMADGAVCGDIFTAPPAKAILSTVKDIQNDKGILCIATNHTGDMLNFELAKELAMIENIKVECVYVSDDITTESIDKKADRRGIAGVSLIVKIAQKASKMGLSLEEVYNISKMANDNIYTFGVTTIAGNKIESGENAYILPDGEIEFGMGFNGETGIKRDKLKNADTITEYMIDELIKDADIKENDEIVIFLNPYQKTTFIESHIIISKCLKMFIEKRIKIYNTSVDLLFSAQGAGGFSISILKLNDTLKNYI